MFLFGKSETLLDRNEHFTMDWLKMRQARETDCDCMGQRLSLEDIGEVNVSSCQINLIPSCTPMEDII